MWEIDVPIYVCAESLKSCPTLCDPKDCSPPSSSVHGDSPGKNAGVGFHALLRGIFPIQGSNLRLLHRHWQAGFFTTSATWEAHSHIWTCVFKCVTYLLLTCIEDLLLCKISWKIILETSVHCTDLRDSQFPKPERSVNLTSNRPPTMNLSSVLSDCYCPPSFLNKISAICCHQREHHFKLEFKLPNGSIFWKCNQIFQVKIQIF